jgi:threonyl-tRNA synthetase
MMEEAKKRDHRVLGSSMELFTISEEVGAGLPLYLPKGSKLRQTLERYMLQEAEDAGYQYVYTPHIAKSDLFAKSGHLSHYADGMFAPISMVNLKGEGAVDGKVEQFYLKPMNCPMHHQIYLHRPRSYRELPFALMEYGTVYRYEESGTLSGLIRVRGFTQNDAHVYCMRSQLFEVISEALARFIRAYENLGIKEYKIRFSLPDFANNSEKYGEETQEWRDAIQAMQDVLDELKVEYFTAENEAAFYGPKIDIQAKNVNGKEDSLSTIQVDFSIAQKFGITYRDSDGSDGIPAIIHMALMGSVDRFMAFLIEMSAGRFPFWVAPEQVRILTINDNVLPYVKEVEKVLRATVLMQPLRYNEVRFARDDRAESLNKKIRNAETDKIPVILVIGDRDMGAGTVGLRTREGESTILLSELGAMLCLHK